LSWCVCAGPAQLTSPPSPSLYVEQLPQSVIAEMTLEERILTEEAWTNLEQGDGARAKKTLIKLGQESPLYYAGLGYALLLLDDIQRAEDFFKAALITYPDLVLIHVGLAQIYQKTGREDSAFTGIQKHHSPGSRASLGKIEIQHYQIPKNHPGNSGSQGIYVNRRDGKK